ncbi:hypothetical protein GQ44DRAFT_229914 [Phaeosphaeriaceae sp. PMI808]|nr:hypothetical protein GQ44DRAFT_229914 [Phaeosphaeriaceae sp. PMI808]
MRLVYTMPLHFCSFALVCSCDTPLPSPIAYFKLEIDKTLAENSTPLSYEPVIEYVQKVPRQESLSKTGTFTQLLELYSRP